MKRIIKIFLIAILGLSLYQIGSYLIYGKRNIEVSYYEYFSPLIQDVDKLHILSTTELRTHEKQEIREILESNYKVVRFSNDTTMNYEYKYDKEITMIRISVDYEFPFHAVVYENLRASDYIEVWESELDWFFGKWVLRKKTNIGQS